MKKLLIESFDVSLFRKNGDFVDSTNIDEKNEQFAKDLFYIDFGNDLREGDYLEFKQSEERIEEEEYYKIGLKNRIIKKY